MTQITLLTSPLPCQAIDVQPGNVVLIQLPREINEINLQRVAEQIREHISAVLPPELPEDQRVHLIFAYHDVTVQSLDEKMMGQAGWFRGTPKPR